VKTLYDRLKKNQAGCPAIAFTFPVYKDMEAMLEDIRKAKSIADIVILSFHWGIHHMQFTLADYQTPVAHAAIDAGADIILGTHPHILKGIEVYKGKVIFYSLGNFAFDHYPEQRRWPPSAKSRVQMELYHIELDPAWNKTYPFQKNARMTMVVNCLVSKDKLKKSASCRL